MPKTKRKVATKALVTYKDLRSTKDYQAFLKRMYAGTKRSVAVFEVPPVRVLAVTGNEPPSSDQYRDAIAKLYGVAYSLRMGLKFDKLPRPKGYFDYVVGALETQWWSTDGRIDIQDAATLRWRAYLMVPSFVTASLVAAARTTAKDKHPELDYDDVVLETIEEGAVAQILHEGPYDAEEPTIARLRGFLADHELVEAGRHHEIYLSDPRRTPAARLRTVIRMPYRARRNVSP